MPERLFSVGAQLIGAFCFTYSITRIVHILTSMNASGRNLTDQLETVSEWASYHEFPEDMVARIKRYLRYKSNRSYFNAEAVLGGLVCGHHLPGHMHPLSLSLHATIVVKFLKWYTLAVFQHFQLTMVCVTDCDSPCISDAECCNKCTVRPCRRWTCSSSAATISWQS